jgi:hypothetical protein
MGNGDSYGEDIELKEMVPWTYMKMHMLLHICKQMKYWLVD